MKVSIAILLAALTFLGTALGCPPGFEYVGAKCYKMGEATTEEIARQTCVEEEEGDHLWIIDSPEELNKVMSHFFGSTNGSRAGAAPSVWTDAQFNAQGEAFWITTDKPVTVELPQGLNPQTCCSGMGCGGGTLAPGACGAIGMISYGATDSGYGMLGCECSGATMIPYICETADVGTFDCPEDEGTFESAPCSNLFFNCFDGTPYQEYCDDDLVFDEVNGYCNFPDETPSCNPETTTTSGETPTTSA